MQCICHCRLKDNNSMALAWRGSHGFRAEWLRIGGLVFNGDSWLELFSRFWKVCKQFAIMSSPGDCAES